MNDVNVVPGMEQGRGGDRATAEPRPRTNLFARPPKTEERGERENTHAALASASQGRQRSKGIGRGWEEGEERQA